MVDHDYESFQNYERNTTASYNSYSGNGTVNAVNNNYTNIHQSNLTWMDDGDCSPASSSFLDSTIFQCCVYLMYCIVFVIALIGNGLVCFVVQNSPRMKTVTNYFIMNLAIGDILMTLFCVPFSFVSMLVLRYWPFGLGMCKVVNYSQAVSVLVSAYTLLAISVDRYMAIMRPLRPRLGTTAAKLIVAAVWGGALSTAAPIFVVSQIQRPSEWHVHCKADFCLEQWGKDGQSEQYSFALMILQFGLPLASLICTYARIAYVVWGGRPPGEAETARDLRIQHSKRKMIKMMVTVVIVFTVCWLPLNMFIVSLLPLTILWTIHGTDDSWATWPGMYYVWFGAHWLAMSHCCYNPFIYCYMNVRYRKEFKLVLASFFPFWFDNSSQMSQRPSMCGGIPMSEMVGVTRVTRQGTSSASRASVVSKRASVTAFPAYVSSVRTLRR